MKIGIHTYAWGNHFGNDTLYIIDSCKKIGMDFIEIPLMEIDKFDPVTVKDYLDGALEPTCSTVIPNRNWDIGSDDPEQRKAGIAFLRNCIEKTAAVGGKMFSGMGYVLPHKAVNPGPASEQEWEYCTAAYKNIAKYAQDFGITVGVEPASRFANHLVNTADQALKFLDMVDEPNVIIHFDSFHMVYEERDFDAAFKKVGNKLGYFHMCGNDRGKPGDDDIIDWDGVFESFKAIGFDGYVGFEGFDMTCDNIYRDIIGNADQFAKDSYDYCCKMMDKHGFKRG